MRVWSCISLRTKGQEIALASCSPFKVVLADFEVCSTDGNDLQTFAYQNVSNLFVNKSGALTPKFRLSRVGSIQLPSLTFRMIRHNEGMMHDLLSNEFHTNILKGFGEHRIAGHIRVGSH